MSGAFVIRRSPAGSSSEGRLWEADDDDGGGGGSGAAAGGGGGAAVAGGGGGGDGGGDWESARRWRYRLENRRRLETSRRTRGAVEATGENCLEDDSVSESRGTTRLPYTAFAEINRTYLGEEEEEEEGVH